MVKVAIGEKIGMTQIFKGSEVVPVSVIEIFKNTVVAVKTKEKDGYCALQLAYGKEAKKCKKPILGQLNKIDTKQVKIKEFRLKPDDEIEFQPNDKIDVNIFSEGEKVSVWGVSKGKGFQGAIKRHNSKRGPETHGSDYHRRPGSLGASSFPARVFKNKKMPGHMGSKKTFVKNLEIVKIDPQNNLLYLKGAVPGAVGSFIFIRNNE